MGQGYLGGWVWVRRSPQKRKIDFKNSDTDSPSKKTKFETTRHFWKKLEDNFEQNTLMGETNLKPGSQENILSLCEDGIICEQLED